MRLILSKKRVLDTLRANKERHILEYKEQFKGWQDAMQKHGDDLKDWAQNHSDKKQPSAPPRPADHLEDYDKLIQKLEHHVEENIEVEEYEFDQLVNDKFNWTRGWLLSNATYASASLSADRIDAGTINENRVDPGF